MTASAIIGCVVVGVVIHVACRGRVMVTWEFLAVVLVLVACLVTASDPAVFEAFAEAGTSGFSAMFSTLSAIPGAVQETITPALVRLIDDVNNPAVGEVMIASQYSNDPYIMTNGAMDTDKFDGMVREYGVIDGLLTSLQQYNNTLFTKLTTV